jgi:hypothetical protein
LASKVAKFFRNATIALQNRLIDADLKRMTPKLAVVRGGNPNTKITEDFLLNLPDVLDASVWIHEDRLCGHVTLSEGSAWTERSLKGECARELGLQATPSEIMLIAARPRIHAKVA